MFFNNSNNTLLPLEAKVPNTAKAWSEGILQESRFKRHKDTGHPCLSHPKKVWYFSPKSMALSDKKYDTFSSKAI